MPRDLSQFLKNTDILNKFDKIKIYYDNGQAEIGQILNFAFNLLFSNVDIVKVLPIDYKLFQVADFICTLELLEVKREHKILSKSETQFFQTKELKTLIKTINKKEL